MSALAPAGSSRGQGRPASRWPNARTGLGQCLPDNLLRVVEELLTEHPLQVVGSRGRDAGERLAAVLALGEANLSLRPQEKPVRTEAARTSEVLMQAVAKDEADAVLRPAVQRRQRYGPFPRPVCLFLFAMENDAAWYMWVAEPIASEDGKPRLRSRDEPDCRPLDKKALKELIERVDVWYDAFFHGLVVNGPGGSKTARKGAKQ